MTAKKVSMVSVNDLKRAFLNVFTSRLIPDSNVMMQMATTLIRGEMATKVSFWNMPSTGPSRTPNARRMRMSGILVFV